MEKGQSHTAKPSDEPPSTTAIVDSVFPVEEALRRFRADIPLAPSNLSGGAQTREELVRNFVRALQQTDTTALGRMLITRAEFAYLYYPTSRASRPPYEEAPDLNYLRSREHSGKGIRRALALFARRPAQYEGYSCSPKTRKEENNILWGPCIVKADTGTGPPVDLSLFGTIIEREGQFKFLSYANQQ
ncbi:MAG: hypothetical protein H7Z74_10455 [Anaerolineae bacterium]|nr:hypothetical protein [Gemmatimonadaceae bacterium]